jgi:histidinol-phosphate aminotransferase
MSDALAPVRQELRGFAGYRSARMEAASGHILLNANECPWAPPGDRSGVHRYPEPQPGALRAALAAHYGWQPDGVLLTRGSDEGVDLLVRACCHAREDAVLVTPPTFGMYAVCARVQDAGVVEVPLREQDGFVPDLERVLQAARRAPVRLLFLCSPNNPVGPRIAPEIIAAACRALQGRALVVVDEAYAEFAGGGDATALLPECSNLVVLRTLSKAHALAGARIGCVLAAPALVAVLRSIQAPYPVPAPCARLALRALAAGALAATRRRVARLLAARAQLARRLAALPCTHSVLPGDGNFLTLRFTDATRVLRALAGAGVLVRDVGSQPGLGGCLRISVGSARENATVLAALRNLEAQP